MRENCFSPLFFISLGIINLIIFKFSSNPDFVDFKTFGIYCIVFGFSYGILNEIANFVRKHFIKR